MNFLDENGLGRLWAQIILKLNSKVPDGGTTGQVLKKTETGTEWADESGADKQDKLTGIAGQMVGFDENGNAVAQELPSSGMSEKDADAKYLQLSGGTMNGQLTMNSRLCVADGQRLDINKAGVGSTITFTGDTAQFLSNVNVDIFKTPTDNVHAANKAYVDSKVPKSVAVTLYADMWNEDTNGRYSQTVSVTGVTTNASQVIVVDVALSGADIDADAAALEAWGIVSANNVAQGNGTLTFYALSVPSVNIPVNVGVC